MKIDFPHRVSIEIARARKLHKPLNSAHEGYAVILEEVDELWQEVKKKREKRSPYQMLEELAHIGAMVQRMAEDVL